jgi:hypothetical protein
MNHIELVKIDNHDENEKFMTIKDTLNGSNRPSFRILTFDSFPTSFIKENKISGVDGFLINEFIRKFNTSYINVHSGDENPNVTLLIHFGRYLFVWTIYVS